MKERKKLSCHGEGGERERSFPSTQRDRKRRDCRNQGRGRKDQTLESDMDVLAGVPERDGEEEVMMGAKAEIGYG
jgi:hypothetical protein